jgi:DNA-binding transcriptional MerR regulator
MPIIQERQTMQDLRAAGFSQQQAEVLAAKLEATAQATQQDLKDFIRQELAQFKQELNTRFAEIDTKFAELRSEMHATQKDLAFKLIATLVAGLSLAVAVIKLFPGAH